MTWGPYYFFYDCLQCGKKYRIPLDELDDTGSAPCPECQSEGKLTGESKDIAQGENPFAEYDDIV